ncbi:MAG: TonB-dependent receptor plug domain-containing protein, partial [Victivallales bacterium]|nr:TonB-dependent receptor plug domain-containing protein [Victivallales bacterium]
MERQRRSSLPGGDDQRGQPHNEMRQQRMDTRGRTRLSRICGILGIVCLGLAPAWGDGAVPREVMVVSARGHESAISQTPGGIGLVNDLDLLITQPLSLSNTTRRIPGVEKSSDSGWGSEINIRGLGRSRIVFLVDGVRINTATDLSAQFG